MVKTFKEKLSHIRNLKLFLITELVRKCISQSGITEGLVFVITAHTSSGIMVNENLPCLMTDIEETLERLVPLDHDYAHSHFLLSYGATRGQCSRAFENRCFAVIIRLWS